MPFDKVWPLPHNARLDQPFQPGQMLNVKAHVLDINLKEYPAEEEPAITVNLASDAHNPAKNIPLHVSIRFREKVIVLNNLTDGVWGKEERHKLMFKLNEALNLKIRAEQDHFELFADGKEFAKFDFRAPLSAIDHVYVNGPIALHGVHWGGKYYSVPYEAGIGQFGVGKRLFVSGLPEKKTQFSINLLAENGDIALHFNPRLSDKVVVRNSRKGGEWEVEERELQGDYPFAKELGFDLMIVNESYSFQIFHNDEKICTFAHRMEPNSIRSVQVDGDLELHSLIVL